MTNNSASRRGGFEGAYATSRVERWQTVHNASVIVHTW